MSGTYTTITVELKYTPQGTEGQDLGEVTGDSTYNGWTILYDNLDGTVEAVSPTVIGDDLTLGYNDSTIDWDDETVKEEADLDGDSTLTNVEKSIYSYNHAIETLNNYAKEQVTTLNSSIEAESVRSVGSNSSDPYNDDSPMYIPSESWADEYNGVVKSGDTNYEQDVIRMSYYGVTNIESTYWLASRTIDGSIYSRGPKWELHILNVDSDGYLGSNYLSYVDSTRYSYAFYCSYGVRPVIKVKID